MRYVLPSSMNFLNNLTRLPMKQGRPLPHHHHISVVASGCPGSQPTLKPIQVCMLLRLELVRCVIVILKIIHQ